MTTRPDLEARLRTMHDRLIECSGYIDVKACRYDCQTMHDLRAAAAIGAEVEREACARLADGWPIKTDVGFAAVVLVVGEIVDAIRARSLDGAKGSSNG